MAELDPSIALPLLRGLARSTGYTKQHHHQQQQQQREEDKKSTTSIDGKPSSSSSSSSSSSPDKSSSLNQPATTPSSCKQKSPQQTEKDDSAHNAQQKQPPLPIKLHHLLSSNTNENVVHWRPHGRSFHVCDYSTLLSLLEVVPVAPTTREEGGGQPTQGGGGGSDGNNNNNGSSSPTGNNNNDEAKKQLSKILKGWGFHQFESGMDVGTFYHEDFLRCHLDKCSTSTTLLMYDEGRIISSLSSSSLSPMEEEEEVQENEDEEDNDNEEIMEEEGGVEGDVEAEVLSSVAASASAATGGGGVGNSNRAPTHEESTFMSITACADVNIARQYLEMSGNQLEMAVSLFMDHNLGGGGGAVALGGGGSTSSSPAARSSRTNDKSPSNKKKGQLKRKKAAKKKKNEPDFYTMTPMPLLIPSSQKKKTLVLPAQKLVQSALKEYCAFRTIRRALLAWIRIRRSNHLQRERLSSTQANKSLPSYNKGDFHHHHHHHGTRHFLFQSLLHPSLPVRRCAARMILHNLHHDDTDDDDDDGNRRMSHKNKILELQEVLIVLLHGVMFHEAPYQIESFVVGSNGGPATLPPSLHGKQQQQQPKSSQGGGDPAIQLMAMLLALVCDGGFSNIIVEDKVKDIQQEQQKYCATGGQASSSMDAMVMGMFLHRDEDILCKSELRALSSDSIESFVASGGLRWACGSIVRLCHLLVHGIEGDDNSAAASSRYGRQGSESDDSGYDRDVERMNDPAARMIQTRLLLLIDLVYKLVLFGTVPAAVDRRGPFTTVDDNNNGKDKERKRMLEKAIARRKENREKVARMFEGSSGDTSRTSGLSALRQSLRSTIASGGVGSPQLSSDKRTGNTNDNGGGGGGGDLPNPNVAEENRQRKERRKSSLERVHEIFWSSTLPAAKCIPSSNIESDSQRDNTGNLGGSFSPLACLIAAYEILRSTPASKSALATNGQLRGLEKSIATLARLVDPAAASAVVVSDPDIPWGMKLPQNASSKKRDRASSHASQDSHRNSSSPSRADRAQQMSDSRAKRARTSGNVTSILERLTEVDVPMANRPSGPSAAISGGAAARASLASQESSSSNSLFASRYRSAMESMLRGATSNPSPSREGSLSRILASSGAAPRLTGVGTRPGSSYSARSSSTAGSPNRSIRARAVASGQVDEWRELDADEGQAIDMDMEDINDDEDDNPLVEHDGSDGSESEFEEVIDIHEGGDGAMNGGGANGEDDEGDGSCDDEDTDEELFEDNGQFDDAVINMEEINVDASTQREDHHTHSRNNPHRQSVAARSLTSRAGAIPSPIELAAQKKKREHAYLRAAMQLLESQYPDSSRKGAALVSEREMRKNRLHSIFAHPTAIIPSPLLSYSAEVSLLRSICNIVKPPRKPLNLKIFMRRAPTQEEFFRGSLSRNPISLSSLKAGTSNPQGSGAGDERSSSGPDEPRVSDLRLHIAKDLQMEDSAELLELLVANKILDINLKLRVVQQVLWRKYVEENATSASSLVAGAGPGHQMISTGSGLSMIFSSAGLTGRGGRNGAAADDNAVLASFPPMVVTYRLAGVDGEATEDKVEPDDLEDPEAPSSQNSPEARERRMEMEFGITRIVTQNRGIPVLLASIHDTISDLLRRIRRDEVARKRQLQHGTLDSNADGNLTREMFAKAPPCPGLILLRHCANLTENRKKLLANRAPTILLRMLLDILNSMNRSSPGRKRSSTIDFSLGAMDVDSADNVSLSGSVASSSRDRIKGGHTEGNPTTQALQEIIELLASDISAELANNSNKMSATSSFADLSKLTDQQTGDNEDDRTLPLVLKSLHSTDLSPPLRNVIAKLLPFLTYGQVSQSKELASYFARYISLESLGRMEEDSILMNTFVETAINLPPVAVCDNLRTALIRNGFVEKVRNFLMEGAPLYPPPWSSALSPKSSEVSSDNDVLKEEWRRYFDRPGVDNAFQILTGLCSKHASTQLFLSNISEDGNSNDRSLSLLTLCHWMESTSDNISSGIKNPNGILAETLLDTLKDGNKPASEKIDAIRTKTRDRKREIAEERRNKALKGMSAFGPMSGTSVADSAPAGASSTDNRSSSMFASMFGLSSLSSSLMPSSAQTRTRASSVKSAEAIQPAKPSWMAEMEALDDEKGVTCAVCQEGRTLQPSELLGLYAYMKKVTIAAGQGGATGDIDGTVMLLSLPISLPSSSVDTWFRKARIAANALEGSAHALTAMSAANSISSGSSGRSNHFITTVSAGNAIHCSCHSKAKAADRNHPKAPKSEWEGASLRNSRVTCNVILPLVSTKTSSVPLMSVENALADVNHIMTNTLGVRPKSMLWSFLHDIRFLLLRMAYGEALNADCGGGSSSSNFLLALYQLYTADMFARNAEHEESPEVSKHARNLSYGFLVGEYIVDMPSFDRHSNSRSKRLERGVAESAPMAALCSILFYNVDETGSGANKSPSLKTSKEPSPTRQWELNKAKFLAGLIRCAGHRHSLGLTDSGCATSKGLSAGRKNVEKTRSFVEWRKEDIGSLGGIHTTARSRSPNKTTIIDDYGQALRPMITLYAVFDQLSKEFVANHDDESTEASSERLAEKLETCYKASNIEELLQIAEVTMSRDLICKYFEKGCTS